jgi:putative membrane protein
MIDNLRAPSNGGSRFEVRATSDSHFSWLRTRLSVERTLMSWVRTATALIGFGFTIVQFFERLHTMDNVAPAIRPEMPRYLGLALIAAGVLSLLVSVWQYHWLVHYMWSPSFQAVAGLREGGMKTPLYFIVIALIFIGLFAFGAVLTRAV